MVSQKKTIFGVAKAMAAMTAMRLPCECVNGSGCEVQSCVTFCCASFCLGGLPRKNIFESLLILRRPWLPWLACRSQTHAFSRVLRETKVCNFSLHILSVRRVFLHHLRICRDHGCHGCLADALWGRVQYEGGERPLVIL